MRVFPAEMNTNAPRPPGLPGNGIRPNRDHAALETLAAVSILRKRLPELNSRVFKVTDQPTSSLECARLNTASTRPLSDV
jgi:hypothetical protein